MIENLTMETRLEQWPTVEHFDTYDAETLGWLYTNGTEESLMQNMGLEPYKPSPSPFIASETIDHDTIIWNPLIKIIVNDINRWGFFLYEGTNKFHSRVKWYIVLQGVKPPGSLA